MGEPGIVKKKSFEFAIRIIELCRYLKERHKDYVLSQQLLRSGTAIGALVREAEFAESRNDFRHKLSIALKEANETVYWLELLYGAGYIEVDLFNSLFVEARNLLSMLAASVKTLNKK